MDFRILGPLEVLSDGEVLDLGGRKQRGLLAVLLVHANEVVSSDRLIDELWGEDVPPTAAKTVQVFVSRLRKALGDDVLVTRAPGYLLRVDPGSLDLQRFEELLAQAGAAGARDASAALQEALALWRGSPLADFSYEPFAQAEIARLQELQLVALEARIEADLAVGRNSELVGELEGLIARHPVRERLRGQLMLALYRSGRQAEALDAYRSTQRLLDEELGLEPSEALKELQKAILAHDPALLRPGPESAARGETPLPERSILVAPQDPANLGALLALAEPLVASPPPRELIIARIVEQSSLAEATAALSAWRGELLGRGIAVRAAAFASPTRADDLVRLATDQNADLILLDAGPSPLEGDAGAVVASAPCDVALLLDAGGPIRKGPVVVPFGAAEHDWAALELGAWIAQATDAPLRLIGAAADGRDDKRDSSRLLADASLIVQRTAGVLAEPLLATPGREGITALAEGAGLLVVGLSERWQQEGLGRVRTEIAESPPAPTVFVRRGLRPGGLAPTETRTRFTWSLTSALQR